MSKEGFLQEYASKSHRKEILILGFLILTLVITFLRMPLGQYNIAYGDALNVLYQNLFGDPSNIKFLDNYVVWNMYIPRTLATLAIGAGLGVCGAAMQSMMKNPLADPYMTGISAGANFGISLAVVTGFSILPFLTQQMSLIGNAFVLSLIPAFFIVVFSAIRKSASSTFMILVGVAVMYVFSAFSTMLNLLASPDQYAQVYSWSLGTLSSVTWDVLPYLYAAAVVAIVLFAFWESKLNLLAFDDSYSKSLGLRPKNARIVMIIVISLVTATLVCFSGTIGFIGLVAPHVMRILIGSDNRYLIPASAVGGAFILVVADMIAVKITFTGLPVGVITGLIGGPLFIYLLIKQRNNNWS